MVDFATLKKNRQANTQKLIDSLNQPQQTSSNDDNRFWKPTLDDEKGVGSAVIRFLPASDEDTLAYVKYYEHAFKGPTGKWYIEKSLSTLGQQDCVGKLNARLWATGVESDKDLARKMKRQIRYVSNILVVNDPAKPENNGKVFLYRYGPKIFEFIQTLLKPEADALTGQTPESIDAFDMWEGANLQIRMTKTKHGWNYDKTDWSAKAPIDKNDAVIEAVFKQCTSLKEFVDEKNYKAPEALEKRLIEVLGAGLVGSGIEVIEGYQANSSASLGTRVAPPMQVAKPAQPSSSADVPFDLDTPPTGELGSDDDDDFFSNLMK